MVGPSKIRAFYNVNVLQVMATGADSIDFDTFSDALVALVIDGLEEQIKKLKKIFKEADLDGNGMIDFKVRACEV